MTTTRALAGALDAAVRQIWPARAHQELVLDLGMRKDWDDAALTEAASTCARWLNEELGLAAIVEPAPQHDASWSALRARAAKRLDADSLDKLNGRLAALFGRSPSTIRNNASQPAPWRIEHQWLALIGREAPSDDMLDVLPFHRRTRTAVDSAMSRLAAHIANGIPDSADVLLLTSLLSLYQRRRPTQDVRATRGVATPRRSVPKPIALLAGSTFPVAVAPRLISACKGDAAVVLAAMEWVFTVAHLAPHQGTRGAERVGPSNALETVKRVLNTADSHLPVVDRNMFRFRLEIMEQYERQRPLTPKEVSDAPYAVVHRLLGLARRDPVTARENIEEALRMVEADAPGTLMLAPQVRTAWRRLQLGHP